jgi:hypothetical protein
MLERLESTTQICKEVTEDEVAMARAFGGNNG